MNSENPKKLEIFDLGLIDYDEALMIQEHLLQLRKEEGIGDTMLILEHEPVITIGKRGNQENILVPREFLAERGIKVCSIGRGGDVTYHGPGQIVGYPIIRFQNHVAGVRELVRTLEEVFIQFLAEEFHIQSGRDLEHPGVWIGSDKITAIGLLIQSGITMHGFAFNVNTDLSAFQWILSCGIMDKGVTSVQKILGKAQDMERVKKKVVQYFAQIFHLDPSWGSRQELENKLGW